MGHRNPSISPKRTPMPVGWLKNRSIFRRRTNQKRRLPGLPAAALGRERSAPPGPPGAHGPGATRRRRRFCFVPLLFCGRKNVKPKEAKRKPRGNQKETKQGTKQETTQTVKGNQSKPKETKTMSYGRSSKPKEVALGSSSPRTRTAMRRLDENDMLHLMGCIPYPRTMGCLCFFFKVGHPPKWQLSFWLPGKPTPKKGTLRQKTDPNAYVHKQNIVATCLCRLFSLPE